ncbi:MAG: hypothetical protein MI861_21095 [Pirellulales bacterium]|nr:hypothetical protein [Pirellulales bacterium]
MIPSHLRLWRTQIAAFRWLPLVAGMFLAGCSKEKAQDLVDSVSTQVRSLAESDEQSAATVLPEAGSVTLNLVSARTTIPGANLAVHVLGGGRPNVVQILTYDPNDNTRRYPCLMLHGTTTVDNPTGLVGQQIQCDLYFQASPTAPVAMTGPGDFVQVEFTQFDPVEKTIQATVGAATLIGSDGDQVVVGQSSLIAMIDGEN